MVQNVDREGSLAGWVYRHGKLVTNSAVPEDAVKSTSVGHYLTDAFVVQPVICEGRTLGVLSVTDRNDGGDFSPVDQQAVTALANKIGEVLVGISACRPLPSPDLSAVST